MLTKVLTRLVLPPGSLIVLLGLALLFRLAGRRRLAWSLGIVATLALAALSTPRVADLLTRSLEAGQAAVVVQEAAQADAIVLLGGGLAPALPPRRGADLSEAADRVLLAARLYRAGKAPLVVATGGYPAWSGAPRSESEEAAALLEEWGVPRKAILVEGSSLDTYANAQATGGLLETRGGSRILLVTSAMHMPRAAEAFRRAGLDVVEVPTDHQAVEPAERTILDWLPDAGALDLSRRALHEWLGRLWYRLRG